MVDKTHRGSNIQWLWISPTHFHQLLEIAHNTVYRNLMYAFLLFAIRFMIVTLHLKNMFCLKLSILQFWSFWLFNLWYEKFFFQKPYCNFFLNNKIDYKLYLLWNYTLIDLGNSITNVDSEWEGRISRNGNENLPFQKFPIWFQAICLCTLVPNIKRFSLTQFPLTQWPFISGGILH